MHEEDRDRLEAVLRVVRAALASDVVGIYLFGSALLGGLRPFSDLDVLVVVARPIKSAARRELITGLLELRGGRAIELTVVRVDRLRPWRVPPEREFLYGEWLRSSYESGQLPTPEADFDLVAVLATALTASEALIGPPLTEVLDPISRQDLVSSMQHGIPGLRSDLAADTANVLLTLARMWVTAQTGEIVPKDVAAIRALDRLPTPCRAVLAHARKVYLSGIVPDFGRYGGDVEETAELLAEAVAEPGAI